jgi:phosphocarrier protein HPr
VAEQTVTLLNPSGLHARPAERFAREADDFDSTITVGKAPGEVMVDAKSVLSVLTLDCRQGDRILIRAEGADADAAVSRLGRLVSSGIGEEVAD